MRSILPEKLQREQDALANEYFNDDNLDMGLEKYILEHGSKELLDFLAAYEKRCEEAEKKGIIIN